MHIPSRSLLEKVVEGDFGLDVVPVCVVDEAARSNKCQVNGTFAPTFRYKPLPPVQQTATFFTVDLVLTCRILHLADVDSVVGSLNEKVYLRSRNVIAAASSICR